MYCGKCGAQNIEDAKFCCVCGAPLEAPCPKPRPEPSDALKKRHRTVGIAVTAAVLVIAAVLVLLLIPAGGYKKTVSHFMDAVLAGDAKGVTDTFPQKLVDETLAEQGWTREELDAAIDRFVANYGRELENLRGFLGENLRISYEVPDGTPLPPDELLLLQAAYADHGITVKDALTVDVEVSYHIASVGSTSLQTVRVIRADGEWCIDITGFYPFR